MDPSDNGHVAPLEVTPSVRHPTAECATGIPADSIDTTTTDSTAATTSTMGPGEASASPTSASVSAPPPATPTTPGPMPPKPRKLSNGASHRRVRSGSGNGSLAAAASASGSSGIPTSGGILIGGLRRRPRVTTHGTLHRQGSLHSSDEDNDDATKRTTRVRRLLAAATAAGTAGPTRQPSLRNVATIVRSNIRQSVRAAALANHGGGSSSDNGDSSASFAGVASRVVSTQRAARGFLAMWTHGNGGGAVHIYKGIHMEKKKLDLQQVVAEFKEIKRRQFYQELVVYALFLTLFFSLLSWLPVHDSYQQNDVVGSLTCREEGVCELKKMGDVYEFAESVSASICNRQDVQAQWQRIGGVRFRQVRVQEEQCLVYNGWRTPCYPFYSEPLELKEPINGSTESTRVYTWSDGLGLLQPRLSNSIFEVAATAGVQSYGTGGYTVDLCDVDVEGLRADEWLSVATRAFSIEFMLINPVTRVFTIGWHVFTNSPSGHMKHYPHSASLRVVGLEESESYDGLSSDTNPTEVKDAMASPVVKTITQTLEVVWSYVRTIDSRIVLWITLALFFITYCIGEASEMTTMGVNTYLKSDMWNIFELTHLLVLASILTYAMRYYLASRAFASHLGSIMGDKSVDEIDHSDVQELLRTFQLLSDLASVGSAISLLKVFKFLRMNSTLNLLWRVLGMATRDLMGFLVIFNLIFLGYSAMGSFAFGFALEEFSTIGKSYGTCFHMLAGEMDYPRLRQANPRLAPVFIVTFIVLVFQILVNMFVAILSEYYESAKNDEGSGEDVEYDVLARVRKYLKSCSPTVVVKRNEVLRLAPKQQVRLISTNLVDQEETRQRAKKLFRGAVWRVVALLRFGVKFDTRLKIGPRADPATVEPTAKERDQLASQIRLSENFDHKAIKDMIPAGITIRLQGDSLLGDALALRVVRHSKLSVECIVLGQIDRAGNVSSHADGGASDSEGEQAGSPFLQPRERILELLGGEKLRIPWRYFVLHLLKNFLKELQESLMRATKLWNYSKAHLVADYHLLLLFESMRDEGRASLRYDEVFRMLDLFLRKDRKKSTSTQDEVRHETLQVMYRFRTCLIDMPSREKEGHNYRPKPVETSRIELGQLEHLADLLGQNCHEMWALERLKQGWTYGRERDDTKKLHPNLVPYHSLSADEQQYDYRSSMETLKTILFMNYTITRVTGASMSFVDSLSRSSSTLSDDDTFGGAADHGLSTANGEHPNSLLPTTSEAVKKSKKPVPQLQREAMSFRRNSTMESSPYSTVYGDHLDLVYCPLPIDTSKVELEPRLLRLVDLLAENAHEVWAKGRMDEGWTYGPQRNDLNKKHPCLVPYIFLTDDEKEYDLNIAKETLKTLIAMKFTLTDRSARS